AGLWRLLPASATLPAAALPRIGIVRIVSGLHVLVGAALRRRREVYRNKPRLANEYDRPLNLALHGIEVRPKLFGCRLIGDHDIDGLAVNDPLCAWRPRDHLDSH